MGAESDSKTPAQAGADKGFDELLRKLQAALGDRLISVILYGSAAMGDWEQQRSDFNVLCVVSSAGTDELARCGPIFRSWRERGNPAPLLLTAEEVRTSTDCFAIEFQDMARYRRVLYGVDAIANLEIDRSFYRAQVECELRSKQIRLRQKAADALGAPAKLMDLMADSLSTFCVLGRHALVLSGREPRFKKAEILADLQTAMGKPMTASNEILAIRSAAAKPAHGNPVGLLERYLGEVDSLVRFVDALER